MDSLQFEELDQVVEERKQDDGDDVHVSLADASLDTEQKNNRKEKSFTHWIQTERLADGKISLQSNSNYTVYTSYTKKKIDNIKYSGPRTLAKT